MAPCLSRASLASHFAILGPFFMPEEHSAHCLHIGWLFLSVLLGPQRSCGGIQRQEESPATGTWAVGESAASLQYRASWWESLVLVSAQPLERLERASRPQSTKPKRCMEFWPFSLMLSLHFLLFSLPT